MEPDPVLRPALRALEAPSYPAAGSGLLRMDGNTNLFGPNPAVAEVLRDFDPAELQHYPSGLHDDLRAAVARRHGLDPSEILIGAGSDELIDLVLRAFVAAGDRVAYPTPSFVMYAFYAKLAEAQRVEVPLGPEWAIDVPGLIRSDAKVTLVATPNNPTGTAASDEDLERMLSKPGGLVVIDEAYAEYAGEDHARRIREFGNLIVLRTFSKAFGLAGLRVGYLCANRRLVDLLVRVKTPFTVSLLAERIAIRALVSMEYVTASCNMVAGERSRVRGLLGPLVPVASRANFIVMRPGDRASQVAARLASDGILVRDLKGFPGMEGCLRATVGRPEHNDRLVAAVRRAQA